MILIACPIQNKDWIIPDYLLYLLNLDYDKKDIALYWIVNNSTDSSLKLLKDFKEEYGSLYADVIIDVYNNPKYVADQRNIVTRRSSTYYWLAALRNKLLYKCVELNCTHVLSSDCDILLRHDTVKQLLSHKELVVSALIYNGYLVAPKRPWYYPNILRWSPSSNCYSHIINKWVKEPWNAPNGKTIPVDFTGACIMISAEAARKASYGYFIQGEDEPFCKQAKKFGNVLCDLSLFNIHVMSESMYENMNHVDTDTYLCKGWY